MPFGGSLVSLNCSHPSIYSYGYTPFCPSRFRCFLFCVYRGVRCLQKVQTVNEGSLPPPPPQPKADVLFYVVWNARQLLAFYFRLPLEQKMRIVTPWGCGKRKELVSALVLSGDWVFDRCPQYRFTRGKTKGISFCSGLVRRLNFSPLSTIPVHESSIENGGFKYPGPGAPATACPDLPSNARQMDML